MGNINKKLILIISILLIGVSVTLSYYVTSATSTGSGEKINSITAIVKGVEFKIEGELSFKDEGIYPGHQNASSIKVTATGNNELIPYNLIWKGTNTLNTPLNYVVYKTSEKVEVKAECKKKTEVIDNLTMFSEECTIFNLEKLGTEINRGTIKKEDTKLILAKDEVITASSTGTKWYYYIVLEYPNLDEPQDIDKGKNITGEITVEESDKKPDINIIAAYIEQEDGTYKDVEDIPQEGYVLNSEKSTCSNEASVRWDYSNKELITSNLIKSGTSCYLYFDKDVPASEVLMATNELVNENGYRYEGLNPNNYVTFNTNAQKHEQLVKIIRNEPIGNISWDSGGTNGENNWTTSDIKTILNGQYLNGEDINYSYRNQSNSKLSSKTVSITGKSLKAEAQKMVENVVWNLGGASNASLTTEAIYTAERSENKYGSNPTTWIGKVGLMYLSDYGYASPTNTCVRTTTLNRYTVSGCYDNNWLYKSSFSQWPITHRSSDSYTVFIMHTNGYVLYNNAFYGYDTNPSVYLKSSVKIVDGDGSSSHPYVLG